MRRWIAVYRPLVTTLSLATLCLAACSEGSGREFARYYDPEGYFVTNVPAANDIMVAQPQSAADGPGVLTGVIASPPQPSPSPQSGLGGFDISATETPDQTIYQALAVTTDGFDDLAEMTLFFLSRDPAIDVLVDEPVRIDAQEGRLIVADVRQEGGVTASIAAAFTLGRGGTGYLVAAIFPPGGWEGERGDFFRVLESFRTQVPPGLETFPVTEPAAA